MNQSKIDTFFKKTANIEETIPASWLNSPLPARPQKRPVGQPPKRKLPPEERVELLHEEGMEVMRCRPDTLLETVHIPAKRGKYKSYTLAEKQEVLDLAEINGINHTSKSLGIAKSTISTWKKELNKDYQRKKNGRKFGGGRECLLSKETEDKLHLWVLEQRDLQLPVSIDVICQRALGLAKENGVDFKASRGWAARFVERRGLLLRARTSESQSLPKDLEESLQVFYTNLKEKTEDEEYEDEFIVNMDEVPMTFDVIPSKTIHTIGEKDVKITTTGGEKRHFTVVQSMAASGKKLPTMVIFKGKRQIEVDSPEGWVIMHNEKAWMMEDLMTVWLQRIFRPYTERRPCLLVLDSVGAHLTDKVRKEARRIQATMAVIPGGCTSKAQPLDVCLNKPFKDKLRKLWTHFIRDKVDRTGGRLGQIST